uniref:hypothetical protein n=1 Tax=Bacillus thuringiensis TaxID=1428 RepID=UPI0020BEA10C
SSFDVQNVIEPIAFLVLARLIVVAELKIDTVFVSVFRYKLVQLVHVVQTDEDPPVCGYLSVDAYKTFVYDNNDLVAIY